MHFSAYWCDYAEETEIPALKKMSEFSKVIGLEL